MKKIKLYFPAKLLFTVLATSFALSAELAFAEGSALSLHVSPEGGGVEYTTSYSNKLHARLGYHQYARAGTDLNDVLVSVSSFGIISSYHHDVKQQIISALADYYYTDSLNSRLSFGLMHNQSNDNIVASESSLGGYTINNSYYAASQVSKLTGTIKYNSVAPYIGLGWGNPLATDKKWGFMFDLGVMYQGKPTVTLNATGSASNLNADLTEEQNTIKNNSLEWAPLMALGIFYHW
jgi:hypothetical protein